MVGDVQQPTALGIFKRSKRPIYPPLGNEPKHGYWATAAGKARLKILEVELDQVKRAQQELDAVKSHYEYLSPSARWKIRPFVFVALPAEVRNMIYDLTLIKRGQKPTKGVEFHGKDVPNVVKFHSTTYAGPPLPGLALLQTCRQIKAEAQSYFYHFNTFALSTNYTSYPFDRLVDASRCIALQHVRRLLLTVVFRPHRMDTGGVSWEWLGRMTALEELEVCFMTPPYMQVPWSLSLNDLEDGAVVLAAVLGVVEETREGVKISWVGERSSRGGLDGSLIEEVAKRFEGLQGNGLVEEVDEMDASED